MPVGGGHAGGHGGGGHAGGHGGGGHAGGHGGGGHAGGHGGGGHHHGGHHHHNYSPIFGFNHHRHHHQHYDYSRPLLYGRFRFAYWGLLMSILLVFGGFVTAIIGINELLAGHPPVNIIASPLDNRLLSYTQSTCQSIILTQTDVSKQTVNDYNVTLYLLEKLPGVHHGGEFSIANQSWQITPDYFQFYNFYLLESSQVTMSFYVAPFNQGSTAFYYVMNRQQYNKLSDSGSINSLKAMTCTNTNTPCVAQFSVERAGDYYFLFYNYMGSPTITIVNTITINKYVYDLNNVMHNAKCDTVGEDSCTLTVPPSPILYPIIITSGVTSSEDKWTDSIDYSWRCTGHLNLGINIILMLSIGGAICAISFIATIIILASIFFIKRGIIFNNNNSTTATTTTHTTAPLLSDNPATIRDELPPTYGAVTKGEI